MLELKVPENFQQTETVNFMEVKSVKLNFILKKCRGLELSLNAIRHNIFSSHLIFYFQWTKSGLPENETSISWKEYVGCCIFQWISVLSNKYPENGAWYIIKLLSAEDSIFFFVLFFPVFKSAIEFLFFSFETCNRMEMEIWEPNSHE